MCFFYSKLDAMFYKYFFSRKMVNSDVCSCVAAFLFVYMLHTNLRCLFSFFLTRSGQYTFFNKSNGQYGAIHTIVFSLVDRYKNDVHNSKLPSLSRNVNFTFDMKREKKLFDFLLNAHTGLCTNLFKKIFFSISLVFAKKSK